MAYRSDLREELNGVHDTFHPVEIFGREFTMFKQSRISIVKVWWNLKRRPEFTWEREDQMKLKLVIRAKIMPPKMTTQSVGRPVTTSRGGGTGGRASRGGGRTRVCSGDQGNGGISGRGGQVGGQGSEVNDGVDGVLDFSNIIAK
ncbi:hypothetical protein Tco_0604581 [Tanacetum coccineum]